MSKTCFFTIVSNNYRHFARTLVASVRAHDPDSTRSSRSATGRSTSSDPRDAYTEIPSASSACRSSTASRSSTRSSSSTRRSSRGCSRRCSHAGTSASSTSTPTSSCTARSSADPRAARARGHRAHAAPDRPARRRPQADGAAGPAIGQLQPGLHRAAADRQHAPLRRVVAAQARARLRGRHPARTVHRPEVDRLSCPACTRTSRSSATRLERRVLEPQPSRRDARRDGRCV